MVGLADLSVEELNKKVQERLNLVTKIVGFAEAITQERGEVVEKEVNDSYTHTVRELKDFGGFSFRCDLGQSTMGGNTIEVWHDGRQAESVFSVNYQGAPDESRVNRFFDNGGEWLPALLHLIAHKDQVIAQIEQEEREEEERKRRARETDERKAALLKRARELMLSS